MSWFWNLPRWVRATVAVTVAVVTAAGCWAAWESNRYEPDTAAHPQAPQPPTEDEAKAQALASTQVLLEAALRYEGDLDTDARVQAVDEGDLSVVDTEAVDSMVRFTQDYDSTVKAGVYQVLIKLAGTLDGDGDGRLPAASSQAARLVLVDVQAGTAYVPVQVFGEGPAFSMEMVLVEGRWQLAPYSLLEIVRLSATLTQ